MINHTYGIVLFLCLGFCLCQIRGPDGNQQSQGGSNQNQAGQFQGGQNTGQGQNSTLGNRIERPCPTFDLYCLRRFFAKHAHCKKQNGVTRIPDPYYRKKLTVLYPRVNLTVDMTQIELRGLNGRVIDFFIDRQTDKAVIVLRFTQLNRLSRKAFFRFHRVAREPIVTAGLANITFSSVTITGIIPKIDDLQLRRTVAFGFVDDGMPVFNIGPSVSASSDPLVATVLAAFLADIPPTDLQEEFLTDGPFYPPTFIQYKICDFGIKVL